MQNPAAGREGELGELRRAETARRVVVVGGGVAGLEAARVAALRGCTVVLVRTQGRVPYLLLTIGWVLTGRSAVSAPGEVAVRPGAQEAASSARRRRGSRRRRARPYTVQD